MLALYLLVGFFIGTQTSQIFNKKRKDINGAERKEGNCYNQDDEINKSERDDSIIHHKIRYRKKMKKYFTIGNNSSQKIDPEKIKVDIKRKIPERNKSSPVPNFIALTVLWAHYAAVQLGLLENNSLSPWSISDDIEDGRIIERSRRLDVRPNTWKDFLSKVITDPSWTHWIRDPEEVKRRTLLAFE
ncbi:MAG: hypothetical protein ACOC2J_02980 [bacterium]